MHRLTDLRARRATLLLLAALAGCREEPVGPGPDEPAAAGSPAAAVVGATNTWEQVASMPSGRWGAVAGSAVDANGHSIVYVFGGADVVDGFEYGSMEAYDLSSNTWITKSARLPHRAAWINGVSRIGGKFYLPGGEYTTSGGTYMSERLQVYNPATDTWTLKRDLPVASSHGVSAVIDGRIYMLAGAENREYDPDCDCLPIVYTRRLFRYDPAQDRWTRLRDAPHSHLAGVAGVFEDKMYVVGGWGPDQPSASLDIYDPATNRWTSGAPLPLPGGSGSGLVIAGMLYFIKGDDGRVVAYNPKTNRWVPKAPFTPPQARYMSAAKATLNGKARMVVQIGFALLPEDEEGRATFVYTP